MEIRNCRRTVCSAPLARRSGESSGRFAGRHFCTADCRRSHEADQRAAQPKVNKVIARERDRIEDLIWMLSTGETRDLAAERLGLTRPTLARWLHRHGQHELGTYMERANHDERRPHFLDDTTLDYGQVAA